MLKIQTGVSARNYKVATVTALVLVTLATAILLHLAERRVVNVDVDGGPTVLVSYLALAIAAGLLSGRAAIFTALLSTVAIGYFFVDPPLTLTPSASKSRTELEALAVLLLVQLAGGVSIGWAMNHWRAARAGALAERHWSSLAMDVTGDHMVPAVRPGTTILLALDRAPMPGDIVAVSLPATQELLLGRYKPTMPEGTFALVFDNDDYPPRAGLDPANIVGVLAADVKLRSI